MKTLTTISIVLEHLDALDRKREKLLQWSIHFPSLLLRIPLLAETDRTKPRSMLETAGVLEQFTFNY